MIQEGVNADQRAHLIQDECKFYQKLQKRFNMSIKSMTTVRNDAQNDNPSNIQIQMNPLSHAKVEDPAEKYTNNFGMNETGINSAANAQQMLVDQDLPLQQLQDKDDENTLRQILEGREIAPNIDKAYMKNLQRKLRNDLFRDWKVKNLNLTNKSNILRLEVYQPALR